MKDQILRKNEIISFLLVFLLTSFIGLTSAVAQNYASTTVNDGLMAYYPFDGNANDASGNGYHATPCNNFQYEEGVVGASIAVVGEGHCVSTGGHVLLPEFDFDVSSGVTLSLWVKALSLSNEEGETYISLGTSVVFEKDYHSERLDILQMPTTISFDYRETEITIPFEDSYVGTWVMYTLACSSDGTMRAYVNGELVGEANVDYDGQLYASLAALGRHWWDYYDGMRTSTRFTGSFDEVRIYNRAITSQEVSLLYNSNHNEGTLPGLFSVGENTQVYFSQGNLQYQASTNTWRFAENQWDYVGDANANISESYDGWIDLFGWGTSGYNHGANCYQPWSISTTYSDYYAYGNVSYELFDQTGQADWGYNAIQNGGNQENSGWRTLTRNEWNYVLSTRNTLSGIRYAKASVNNINGLILLPDTWSADTYNLSSTNSGGASFSSNTLTGEQWSILEQAGAVFLPAAGFRSGSSVVVAGSNGYYWTAVHHAANRAFFLMFDVDDLYTETLNRYYGSSVRLVRPAENYSFEIQGTPSPAEGGTIMGAGNYDLNATCTLTATANEGYAFVNWTENGEVVSTDATYSFTVTGDRNIVANFTVSDHAYVDLGLPSGTLWATCNIGADAPEDYGDYFAWGETQPKSTYDWSTYQYCNGSSNTMTKYCSNSSYGYNGFTDDLTTLLPEDDAAMANWGDDWRMPTKEEWEELFQNTTHVWTTQNGVIGRLFTASNGYNLFLPAAGYYDYSDFYGASDYGSYWSSSPYIINSYDAYDFYFDSYRYGMDYTGGGRYCGHSVRAVRSSVQNTAPTGAINGLFSVGENTQVYFSQGNLQYQASTNTWRFADNQYDYVGNDNANISETYDGWIDIFGWGTSGYNHGANCYQPWSTSTSVSDYYAYGQDNFNLYDQTGQADWGYNAISNGGNSTGLWRTLTQSEWDYVFNTRSTASGIRYAKANVNNVNGVILLPNTWNAHTYSLSNTNEGGASYSNNVLSGEQWSVLEQAGAVFLPAAGGRTGSSVEGAGSYGVYWSASYIDSDLAHSVYFPDNELYTGSVNLRHNGLSVRLVRPIENYSFEIQGSLNPAEGGTITGTGTYGYYDQVMLTANANEGYTFYQWKENGNVISTENPYSFVALFDRNLEACYLENNTYPLLYSYNDDDHTATVIGHWDGQNASGDLVIPETVMHNGESYTVTAIGDNAFSWSSGITSVVIPNTVTSIENAAFYECGGITELMIPNTVISIGEFAFGYCYSLTSVVLPSSLVSLGTWAFRYCLGLNEIVIPSSVTTIGAGNPFAECSNLSQIIVESGNVNYDSRDNCNAIIQTNTNCIVSGSLSTTTIPNSVTSIGWDAFYGIHFSSLTVLTENPPTLSTCSFCDVDKNTLVYVPCGSLEAYQNAEGWNEFTNFIEMCPGEVAVTANHAEYGTVSGGGSFEAGETCTVTATPNEGYYFLCWMEDGQGVSTETTYTFPVYRDHDLTAVFYSTLGDEMVINGDFEQGNEGFTSGYWYYYAFGGAGQYYVDNNTHYPGLGHGGTGNFMMIDGATEPNVNIWTEEISVVPNTYYTLSTWVCTLNPESLALLQFSINGTQIGCVTAPSQTNTWQQYITLWYSGNATAATITIIDQNTSGDGNDFGVDDISFREIDPSVSGGDHAYVDLGLPSGTLWATCNIGADAPEDYGDYFAWGETQPKDNYDWNTYQYCMGNGNALTKYCNDPDYGYNGFTDALTILLPEDDAATANWGNSWRMPTKEEFDELYLNTTWTRTTLNGVNGCLFTALNGNSIFLPAAGAYDGSSIGDAGSKGNYWSSSLDTHYPHFPYRLYFDPNYFFPGYSYSYRCFGHPVRPVRSSVQNSAPTGAINGLFSVGENTQVYFSQGNLQYQASTNTWRFADNQWDYVGTQTEDQYGQSGGTVEGSDNRDVSSTYEGWIDLFSWGTSGYNHGAVCYQPWSISQSDSDYYAYGDPDKDLYDNTGTADWGYNPISNGGNQTNQWRSLTTEEMLYLLETRTTNSNERYVKARVNGVGGLIILPDSWDTDYYSLNYNRSSFNNNNINLDDWGVLEQYGCVFLPVGGTRVGAHVVDAGVYGRYWTSSHSTENYPYYAMRLDFGTWNYTVQSSFDRFEGYTVRLVRNAQEVTSYQINAVPNPSSGGTITGAGIFYENATCTLTATAHLGFVFQNWTENGEEVSTDATYSFTVTGDRDLVANFIVQGEAPIGAVQGLFSVGEDTQVYFSQGNLQYQASTNTWRFAENQWDIIGEDNTLINQSFEGWIDLFSWGTSGYDHGAVVYQPWILEMGGQFNHAAYGCDTCGLRSYNGQADWGYNPILNGGNQEHLWNTMTTQEWQYLLNTRNTASGMRYAKAVMNDINGLVVFPDDWNAELFQFNNVNSATVNYNTNVISLQDWTEVMEVHGAVFLPAAGRFHGGNGLMDVGTNGSYWTASAPYSYLKTLQYFTEDNVAPSSFYPHCRYAVRLVRFTNTVAACSIEATPNPAEGGVVTGAGNYYVGTTATLMASANNDYTFLYWTEDGMVVSTNATYTFTVTGNRTLVANFASQGGVPVGAVNSLFSINDNGDQVYFSQGNLQYQASTNTWRFAENQWDYVGNETYGTVYEDGDKCNNRLVSETYSGWIDLFGWATSGYDHGGVSYQPWSISQNNSDYYAYGSQTCNLSDQTGKADWGYNAISNGGNQEHLWRSMTNAEWRYLLNQRNTTSGVLYAKATVNEVGGVLLLPDDWKTSTYNLTNVNNENASYSSNIITLEDWENILQNAGAIFLPTCWSRVGTEMDLSRRTWGMYWTGSYINSYMAYPISFSNSHLDPCSINGYDNRWNGQGVRLVCAAEAATTYSINAIPNPDDGGTITGAGNFAQNALCTLTATANSGYAFLYWTENGEVVSTNVTYTFTVTDNRTLTACFSETVDDDIIVFADENVKALCVANWDTDGDGELSYTEAAAVTDIGLVFSRNGSITSFNEFQYFTGVTSLEQYAFAWSSIASIVIPSSVTTIDAAFYAAGNLISITIPESVTSISSSAFSGCDGLEQIIVEEGNPVYDSRDNCNAIIRTENNELIQGCMNTVIPNTVTAIGWNAFSLIGSLTSITIPESVISISYTSFYACSGLERIIVKPNNPVYDSRGNCNAIIEKGSNKLVAGSKNTVIPNTVTSIGSYAFSYRYDGQACSLIIPSSVSVLESRAFMGCRSLVSLTIPHTVVSIGDYCFDEGWNLESTTVLATEPPVLGQNVFDEVNANLVLMVPCNTSAAYQNAQGWNEFTNIQEDCSNMFVIDIALNPVAGGTVTGAGTYQQNSNCTVTATAALGYVFENWTVDGVEVSDDATYTFTVTGDCSLVANFTVTESADFIVFADPATKAICVEHWDTNGDGELSYAEAAAVTEWHGEFDYASITSFDELQYFTGLTTVGFYITYYMTSVILPNSITYIGYYGFAWCNALTSIVIPNSVTSIHANAFVGCSNMTTVTIGNSVAEIHNEAFKDCTGLESIYVLAETPPTLGTDVFITVNMAIPVHVPCGTLEAYQNADGWSEFTNIQEDCTDQKNISVTVNPAAGGIVNGAGNYQVGTTATLSCMANSGYEFSNWMENGEVVSTDVTYSFTVTSDRSLVANFTETTTPGANHWIPDGSSFEDNMSFTAVIQINGVEQHSEQLEVGAFCGEQCRGSQLAQLFEPTQRHLVLITIFGEYGDMIRFRLYDHATVQEMELTSPAPVEFNTNGYGTPTKPYVLNFTTAGTQTQALSDGWNWWCSSVELEGGNGLAQLENSLGGNGLLIKSRNDGYVQPYDDNGNVFWFGSLDAIYNEQFYKVRTSNACGISFNGVPANPADHPITIDKGWNWIGFPSQQSVNLQTALTGLNPEPDDIIKGRNGFASYFSQNGYNMWYGSLNTLEPGQGYMYQSNYNGTKTFTYSVGRGETAGTNITPKNNFNQPESSGFADNMTLIAVVEMGRKELRSADYELAAFVGDECRGSAKLMFAPFINRYVAFLTVFGETSEQLYFVLTDGTEKIPSDDEVTFLSDCAMGTLTDPIILHFNSTGIADTSVSNVSVRPNPSTGIFLVEGDGIERVEVFNALGQLVLVVTDHSDSVRIDLSGRSAGIYLVRAITASGLSNITIVKE